MKADAIEERQSTSHQFDSAKIFNTIKQFEKWREEQYQEFRKKQILESQRYLGLHNESYESIEQSSNKSTKDEILKVAPTRSDASCSSLGNDFDDTLQESSITGHLQRCFDDSSQSNLAINPNKVPSVPEKIPIFSEIRNLQFLKKYGNEKEEGLVEGAYSNGPQINKRPFLKKGAGLLRFTTEGAAKIKETKKKVLSKSDNPPVKTIKLPQKNLKLKPAIRKTDVPSEQVKHIRFAVPPANHEKNVEYVTPSTLTLDSKLIENTEVKHDEKDEHVTPSSTSLQHDPSDWEFEEQPNVANESFSSESKELAEFEMLENCAQNSSFNSDSSILQRVIHGKSNKIACSNQKEPETIKNNTKPSSESHVFYDDGKVIKKPPESSVILANIGFDNCRKEVEARKQELEKVIASMVPRIKSLENEVIDPREQFRTPTQDLDYEERILSPPLPEKESNECSTDIQLSQSPSLNVFRNINNNRNFCRSQADAENKVSEDDVNYEEESVDKVPDELQVNEQNLDGKSRISEKLAELQNEIETYQQLNAKLTTTFIERTEVLRKLQKERDDFEKYKENERKKLEAEIKEERRQLKRQKESFTRLQKLSKDHPTRKEREELNALRQEIEKQQEELKRLNLRYSSESRKWKNRIDLAEKDRDILQLENIKLEEQCQDLLAALKPRMKKRAETKLLNYEEENEIQDKKSNVIPEKKNAETQTDKCSNFPDLKESSPAQKTTDSVAIKNNFKIAPEYDKNELEIPINDIDGNHYPKESCQSVNDNINVSQKNSQSITKDPLSCNLSTITMSSDAEFTEIKYGNRVERIHATGERELFFNSGTKKLISADRKSITFYFYNGDVKEINPDKHEIYRFVNGVIETTFPDGLKVTKFPIGQTQYHYPDGKKEIKFLNGTYRVTYADGSEKFSFSNGNTIITSTDGTKTIKFPNGQVEIRTATYKRREFPDGAVKILYSDGKEESRFSDGRVKIKNKDGETIFDTKHMPIK